MIEAIPSLQQVALCTRLAHAAVTLAKREAEKAVKQALMGKGSSLSTSRGGRSS
jgi:hypothetical protein